MPRGALLLPSGAHPVALELRLLPLEARPLRQKNHLQTRKTRLLPHGARPISQKTRLFAQKRAFQSP